MGETDGFWDSPKVKQAIKQAMLALIVWQAKQNKHDRRVGYHRAKPYTLVY